MNDVMPRWWLAFLFPLCLLLLHAFYYYPFFVDDAWISLRYAERLVEGKGLNWNDGEYVEGYSNLLWVLLAAGLGALGFDWVGAGRVICLLSSIATMAAFMFHHRRIAPGKVVVGLLPNLAFAFSAPVAMWSVGGLEGTLVMALLAWAFVIAFPLLDMPDKKTAALAGLLLGFVCITRPEGAFFTMVTAAGLFLFARYQRRYIIPSLFILCLIPFLFFAAQVAFRLSYYGDWLPNSYYAKVAGLTYARLLNGWLYVLKATASFLPIWLLIFLHVDKLKQAPYQRARRLVWFSLFVSVAWLTSVFLAGGDMEPGYRHILMIVPLIVLMLMECTVIAYASGEDRKTHIFFGVVLASFLWLQCTFDENIKAKEELWEWQMKELGEWLGSTYKDTQPLIAVSNAGAIPFYSKLPTLDMYGINDRVLTRTPSPRFGHGFLGHELFNTDYVLKRKPDIVIFFTGYKKAVYGADIDKNPEFLRLYETREIQLPSYTPIVWVRKDSKKLRP